MKVITTNLLNRFWKNGMIPIKEELKNKLDTSKIVASTKISEAGKVMDGKTASEEFAKLDSKLFHYDISVAESKTGKTFNGKPIYCKLIDLGDMPNATSKTVATGLVSIADRMWVANGYALSTNHISYPLPYIDLIWENSIMVRLHKEAVYIQTKSNWSGYKGYVLVEYTKL